MEIPVGRKLLELLMMGGFWVNVEPHPGPEFRKQFPALAEALEKRIGEYKLLLAPIPRDLLVEIAKKCKQTLGGIEKIFLPIRDEKLRVLEIFKRRIVGFPDLPAKDRIRVALFSGIEPPKPKPLRNVEHYRRDFLALERAIRGGYLEELPSRTKNLMNLIPQTDIPLLHGEGAKAFRQQMEMGMLEKRGLLAFAVGHIDEYEGLQSLYLIFLAGAGAGKGSRLYEKVAILELRPKGEEFVLKPLSAEETRKFLENPYFPLRKFPKLKKLVR